MGSRSRLSTDRESTRLNSSHAHISYAGFFFNDTATTEIYTLSLHDALPICLVPLSARRPIEDDQRRAGADRIQGLSVRNQGRVVLVCNRGGRIAAEKLLRRRNGEQMQAVDRSGEHTSELQSRPYLVCRLFF